MNLIYVVPLDMWTYSNSLFYLYAIYALYVGSIWNLVWSINLQYNTIATDIKVDEKIEKYIRLGHLPNI